MKKEGSGFDYQSVLEACGIQDDNIKIAVEQLNEYDQDFHDEFDKLKQLTKEKNQKMKALFLAKLAHKKKLQEINKSLHKLSTLTRKIKTRQDETTKLHCEAQKQSDEFGKTLLKMDDQLNELYAQFEGETLTTLISETAASLLLSQDTEIELKHCYEKLLQHYRESHMKECERIPPLGNIFADNSQKFQLEYLEMKIAEKRNNIEFLEKEYNKKVDLLTQLG